MGWFVSALGVALALAGAAAIASGVPYIQLEWGWTEVIAGTTAMSAGIVTLALGAVLFALRGLRRGLDTVAGAAGAAAGLALGPVQFPDADAETEGAAALARPDSAIPTMPDPVDSPAKRHTGWLTSKLRGARDKESESPIVGEDRRTIANGVDDDGVPLSPSEAPASDADGSIAHHEPSVDPVSPLAAIRTADVDRENAGAVGPGNDHAASLSPSPKADGPLQGPSESPTVVGRYQAGGASYVLFSDGTIEVETDTGTHRFASMQDLRDHIGRQDAVE